MVGRLGTQDEIREEIEEGIREIIREEISRKREMRIRE